MDRTLPTAFPLPGFYYHYKHDPNGSIENYAYEVLGLNYHTEEDCRPEDRFMVDYRPLYESALVYRISRQLGVPVKDSRPLAMFMERVAKDGAEISRFTRIEDPALVSELTRIRARMYE